MRTNNQCSMALHMLIVIDIFKWKKMTSEKIAKSVGCDSSIIRALLGKLQKAEIVKTQRGSGGTELLLPPEEITVWKVYSAVDSAELSNIFGLHPHPFPECPIGRNIHAALSLPYDRVREAIRAEMQTITLKDLIDECANSEGVSMEEFIEICRKVTTI